jgi:hypothetical protein
MYQKKELFSDDFITKDGETESQFIKKVRLFSKKNLDKVRKRKKCEACGTKRGPFEVHHVKHRSQGGGDDLENLACLCRQCHRGIHDCGDVFEKKDAFYLPDDYGNIFIELKEKCSKEK